ncbi:MAG: hypothetical protein ACK524_06725 [Planctomyces sp.]
MLLKILSENQAVGMRRTFVQGPGELASGKLIPTADQNAVRATLLKLYAEGSDPGVHSAAGWSLTQLEADETNAATRRRFGTGQSPGQRWWYENKFAGIGMAIVAARRDSERDQQNSASDTTDDRERSGRLAISMCEITEQQYLLSPDASVADTR